MNPVVQLWKFFERCGINRIIMLRDVGSVASSVKREVESSVATLEIQCWSWQRPSVIGSLSSTMNLRFFRDTTDLFKKPAVDFSPCSRQNLPAFRILISAIECWRDWISLLLTVPNPWNTNPLVLVCLIILLRLDNSLCSCCFLQFKSPCWNCLMSDLTSALILSHCCCGVEKDFIIDSCCSSLSFRNSASAFLLNALLQAKEGFAFHVPGPRPLVSWYWDESPNRL